MPLDVLPDELLLRIFGFLEAALSHPHLSLVCHRWRSLSNTALSSTKALDFEPFRRSIVPLDRLILSGRCSRFRTLSLAHCLYCDDALIERIMTAVGLASAAAGGTHRNNSNNNNNYHYQQHHVSNSTGSSASANRGNDGSGQYAGGARFVRTLNLTGCFHLTDSSLLTIGTWCPNLRRLQIPHCGQLTDSGFIQHILCNSPIGHQLQELDAGGPLMVTDSLLNALADHCPELKTLVLRDCQAVRSIESLKYLLNRCKKLTTLKLRFSRDITYNQLVSAFNEIRHQMELGCLRSLQVENFLGPDTHNNLFKVIALRCTLIEELDVDEPITNRQLLALLSRCGNIRTLVLHYCYNITDISETDFPSPASFASSLDEEADQSSSQTADATAATTTAQQRAHRESTSTATNTNSNDVTSTVRQSLKVLKLFDAAQLTDAALQFLLNVCPNLEELVLTECRHLSPEVVHYMKEHCESLHVRLFGCRYEEGGGIDISADFNVPTEEVRPASPGHSTCDFNALMHVGDDDDDDDDDDDGNSNPDESDGNDEDDDNQWHQHHHHAKAMLTKSRPRIEDISFESGLSTEIIPYVSIPGPSSSFPPDVHNKSESAVNHPPPPPPPL